MKASEPIQIGKHQLKNRITFAPTVKFDYTDDSGVANEKHVIHYEERAKGGCGLICVEATAVLPEGRFCKTHMGLWDDNQIEGHKRIVEACHSYGTIVILQLNHTGYCSNPECGEPVGPSAIPRTDFRGNYTTKEMSVEEIKEVQNAFVTAAIRAKKAGYDGVQLHACHGYLLNQFASALTNKRTDSYGGCVKNRALFTTEIIREIRNRCKEQFLISVRTSGFETSLEDAIEVAAEYVKAGCEYLQVSSGTVSLESVPAFRDPNVTDIQSVGAYFHDAFRDEVPVSCVGGIKNASQVHYLLEHDYADTVDVARAILADPAFANAVLEGREVIPCFSCKACQFGPFTAHVCPAEQVRIGKI